MVSIAKLRMLCVVVPSSESAVLMMLLVLAYQLIRRVAAWLPVLKMVMPARKLHPVRREW